MDYKEKVIALLNSQELSKEQKEKLEEIFPELKESEDERIRKEILEYFQQFENEELRGVNISDWIAWIEKQGEQKSEWSDEDDEHAKSITSTIEYCKAKYPNSPSVIEAYNSDLDWLKSLRDKVLPQKQEWREEDEKGLGDALWCCKQAASIAKDENDMGNAWYAEKWLKSLKERVQPQPKQDWSEEDERRFNNLCFLINQSDENVPTKEGFINWLKSFCHHKHNHTSWWYECIKECVGFKVGNVYNSDGEWIYGDNKKCAYDERFFHPQSHWKPSDEQMLVMEYIKNCFDFSKPSYREIFISVYKQLKAL